MGWKNVKEHYGITYPISADGEGIHIGAHYNNITIGHDGVMKVQYRGPNKDMLRYQREMDMDPEKLRSLVLQPDTFERSLTVYTYDRSEIIEKQCEELGSPNMTHDGEMMCENTFSPDKAQVVQWAKINADIAVRCTYEQLREAENEVARIRALLASFEADREKLEEDFPNISVGPEHLPASGA